MSSLYSEAEESMRQEIQRLHRVCWDLQDEIKSLEKENEGLKRKCRENGEEAAHRKYHHLLIEELCMATNNCADCYDEEARQTDCEPESRLQLFHLSENGFSIEPYFDEKCNQKLLRLAEEHGYIGELIKDGDDHFLHFFRCRAIGVVFQYASGEYELWEDIKLSPEEEAKVRNIFCAHKAEASTIKGFQKVLMKERKSENGKDY